MLGDTVTGRTDPTPGRAGGLTRSRTNRVLAGVCGGLGAHLGVDPLILRVAFVAMTLAAGGAGIIVYLVAWILIPEAEGDIVPRQVEGGTVARLIGGLLVMVGGLALIDRLVPWFDQIFWPVVVILIGIAMFVTAREVHREGGHRDRAA
jgi:phage shock protein C